VGGIGTVIARIIPVEFLVHDVDEASGVPNCYAYYHHEYKKDRECYDVSSACVHVSSPFDLVGAPFSAPLLVGILCIRGLYALHMRGQVLDCYRLHVVASQEPCQFQDVVGYKNHNKRPLN